MSSQDIYISKLHKDVNYLVRTVQGQKKKEKCHGSCLQESLTNPLYTDHVPSPYTSSVSPCYGGESVKASYILKRSIDEMSSFLQQMVYSLMSLQTDWLNVELTKLYGPGGDLEGMHLHMRPSTPSERLRHYAYLKKRCRLQTGKKRIKYRGKKR